MFNSDPSGKWIKYRYINDQGARNIGSIKLGTKSNVRYAGCELVAIYNLLVYLKNAQSFLYMKIHGFVALFHFQKTVKSCT